MENKKFIPLIILVSCLMSAPAALAWISLAPNLAAERIKIIHTIKLNFNSIFLAKNESEAADNESQSTNENKDQAPNSEAAEKKNSGSNSNAALKTL